MHDLVITGGRLVDGTGGPARPAGVAVDGDRIVEVGDDVGPGRRTIDAEGRTVMPGWVDVHTHYDGQATWDPELSPSGWHGVTTLVMGNCGVGFAPCRAAERDVLIELMEGVEDIPGTALAEGMTWNWESFPDYLDELDRMARVADVAALVPHGAVRTYVMGGRGAANEPATPSDREAMAALVAEAVAAGAVGFSTTRTLLHRSRSGELAAGTTADADELIAMGEALGRAGGGVFEVASDMWQPDEEFAWMREVARRSGGPVTFGCLQDDFRPDHWRRLLELAAQARADGLALVPQVAGKPASLLLGWETSLHPFTNHPAYLPLAGLPRERRLAELQRPEVRAAMVEAPMERVGVDIVLARWDRIFPLGDPPDYEPGPEASVAALAAAQGTTPEAVAYDLLLADGGSGLLYLPLLGYTSGDLGALHEMLLAPGTVLGLGDGGAHCGMLCDASLPSFLLTHWVRDRSRGPRLTLEQAVHHQTARTAALYGFDDRGVVAPGMQADLNVVDVDAMALEPPRLVWDLPAGGRRLVQRATGYAATVKSGRVTYLDGVATGERPGGLLRRAGAT